MSLSSGDNPVCGQVSASTTPQALGSLPCTSVVVGNDPNSSDVLAVGDANNQFFNLKPGQAITIPCGNISMVWVSCPSSATCNFISVS